MKIKGKENNILNRKESRAICRPLCRWGRTTGKNSSCISLPINMQVGNLMSNLEFPKLMLIGVSILRQRYLIRRDLLLALIMDQFQG